MFDKVTSKLAITVPWIELHLSSDGIRRRNWHYNEPYIVSFAVDSHGTAEPRVVFNINDFPNVQRGDRVEMIGDGHLVYGPAQPGEFVAVSILLMEKDQDVRDLGAAIEEVASSEATGLGLKTVLSANPSAVVVSRLLQSLADVVANRLKKNSDDRLLRIEGTFLRDSGTPYSINRLFIRRNSFAEIAVKVIPLEKSNGQGTSTRFLCID